jgi:PTS system nitrogen regulatory IIA component
MMHILERGGILADLKAASKKQVLQELARAAASATDLPERRIFDVLTEREKLGTTGIGQGIAIPHGKLTELSEVVGFFARLARPVDFDSVDSQPVDLVFMLLAPEGAGAEHLKALAKVSRLLRDRHRREKLRGASGADALRAVLLEDDLWAAA